MFAETTEKKTEDSILLECCCTRTVLEGISNWINNCLIPIILLDLPAQTKEAVSYGKKRKKKERRGESERHGETLTDEYMRRNRVQGSVF